MPAEFLRLKIPKISQYKSVSVVLVDREELEPAVVES
jgi:hypothetical protein